MVSLYVLVVHNATNYLWSFWPLKNCMILSTPFRIAITVAPTYLDLDSLHTLQYLHCMITLQLHIEVEVHVKPDNSDKTIMIYPSVANLAS